LTHEKFRQRLDVLERERGLRRLALEPIYISAPGEDPSRASGPDNFTCYRRPFEELVAFEWRVYEELRAYIPHPRVPPVLIFLS
jgi:hypothetical protein